MNFTNNASKALRLLATTVVLAASLTAGSALGQSPRRMIGNGTNTAGNFATAISWSAEDGDAVVTPWQTGSNDCVYVLDPANSSHKITINKNDTFPDVPVELCNTHYPFRIAGGANRTLTFPQITVKSGANAIVIPNSGGTMTLNGGYTIDTGATFALAAWNIGSGTQSENFTLIGSATSSLAGDGDTVVSYRYTVNDNNIQSGDTMASTTLTIGSGDASGFLGKYVVSDPTWEKNCSMPVRAHLVFNSATAFGDPTSVKADAVTLGDCAYLSLGANVEQYATRGVTIAAGKKGGVEAADNTEWTLTAPVTCETGATFLKVGEGTVTLDGDCTGVSAMEVTEGTLVLGAFGSFANGLAVTVKPGATLVQNKFVGNIAVTCEEGGTHIVDVQYIVPYSDATGASTPLDFTAAVPALPLSIRLSEPVEIASFADNGWTAKRITVARLPAATTATAADFADATEKYCCLPKTSFEIVNSDGCKELVLVAKPVVWSIASFNDTVNRDDTINGKAGYWSYGDTAQSGYDYLMTNWLARTGNQYQTTSAAFAGDSLTFCGDGVYQSLAMNTPNADFGAATYCGTVDLYYNNSSIKGAGYTGITRGTATIADGATLRVQTRQPTDASTVIQTNRIAVAISGDGNLELTSTKLKSTNPYYCVPGGAPVYLGGDNSGFSGKMIVTCYGSPTESDGTTLHLGQGASFGGAMTAAAADGVLLEKYGFLYPETSMTLSAANRGITITSGGFDVPEGVALTVAVPLAVNGPAIKKGAGELALGGAATFGSGGTFTVKEGSVRALSDAAVAGNFSFTNGTMIVLDPGAALVNGFCGDFAVTGEGTPKVTIAVDTASAAFSTDGAATLPICTVPATDPDLTGSFAVANVRGCDAALVKENVTVGGNACVRYSLHYSTAGTVLYVR